MKFRYEGFDKVANVKRGFINAATIEDASQELRERYGIIPQSIEPDSDEPMKTVLPGGEQLNYEKEIEAKEAIPAPDPGKTVIIPKGAWRENLKRDLAVVFEVCAYAEKIDGLQLNLEAAQSSLITKAIEKAVAARVRETT